uniref:RNA helicase n=1 Tax=Glossina brevipalpis TaxID=37001 RepID=A0A1A9X3F0_9MUSC
MNRSINSFETEDNFSKEDFVNPADTSLMLKALQKGLVDSKLDLEVQRQDPNSPLFSVRSFEGLHLKPEILRGIYAMGFNAPSKIQETALPILLADPPQNMIAQSQSGTGKTAAFVIAMVSRVNTTLQYPQVLCLSPTYELAVQIAEETAKVSKFVPGLSIKIAVSGEILDQHNQINEHIIIGTPGKMLDWSLKYRVLDLKKINVFVLDEADVMITGQGLLDQCIRIRKELSCKCQMLFFSATYQKEIMDFARYIVPSPNVIQLKREEQTLDNIKQYYVRCRSPEDKYKLIENLYGNIIIGQAIIFCRSRKMSAWLARKMSSDGHSVAVLSGELTVEQRLTALDRFRVGYEKVLIATNVLSRGIDIEQVTIVVNFDLPIDGEGNADCETYLHRIGRTGRFGKNGIAINLIHNDETMKICFQIENHFKRSIKEINADNMEDIENLQPPCVL